MRQNFIFRFLLTTLLVLLFLNFAGTANYQLDAFEVELDVNLSREASTVIKFPPIGKVLAETHNSPVELELTLEAIHKERLNYIINNVADKDELVELLNERGSEIMYSYLWRLLLIALLAGVISALITGVSRRNLAEALILATLIFALLMMSTYYSYDIDQFSDPSFSGMLEAAPWMTGLIQEGLENIDQLGYQLELITANISDLFIQIEGLAPLSQQMGDLRVLHVSDIHNNPAGLRFVLQAARSFAVDLIIDTGDITDYGTPLEGKILEKLSELEVPYIFIPGNHDSAEIVEKMSQKKQVEVLDGKMIERKGLKILGLADPAAASNKMVANSEQLEQARIELNKLYSSLEQKPDIVAVHQKVMAKDLIREVPTLLHGHTHSFELTRVDDTVILDTGTTGSAGIRGLQSEDDVPYTVSLLHYNLAEENKLKFIDIIEFYTRHGGFTMERQLIN